MAINIIADNEDNLGRNALINIQQKSNNKSIQEVARKTLAILDHRLEEEKNNKEKNAVLLFFTAKWAGPAQQTEKLLEEISLLYQENLIVKKNRYGYKYKNG